MLSAETSPWENCWRCVDAIRIGGARERGLAAKELEALEEEPLSSGLRALSPPMENRHTAARAVEKN